MPPHEALRPLKPVKKHLPPAKCVTSWKDDGIFVGHEFGTCSVHDNSGIRSVILNHNQNVYFVHTTEEFGYASFESGILARYTLPIGVLDSHVDLEHPISGIIAQDTVYVAWSKTCKLYILEKRTLAVYKVIDLISRPLRVLQDKDIVVCLQSGVVQWFDKSFKVTKSESLPLDQNSGTLVDAVLLSSNSWLMVQRRLWGVCDLEADGFSLELSASCSTASKGCIFDKNSKSASLVCYDGSILNIEHNNVQVLPCQWDPLDLVNVVHLKTGPVAVTSDLQLFKSETNYGAIAWSQSMALAKVSRKMWLKTTISSIEVFIWQRNVYVLENDELKLVYETDANVNAVESGSSFLYLGLVNGTVIVLDTIAWTWLHTYHALPTSILGLHLDQNQGVCVAWTKTTVAVMGEGLLVNIPGEHSIVSAATKGTHVEINFVKEIQIWDYRSLDLVSKFNGGIQLSTRPPHQSCLPYTCYKELSRDSLGPEFGVATRIQQNESLAFFDTISENSVPVLGTLLAVHGMSLNEVVPFIRENSTVERYEKFVLSLQTDKCEVMDSISSRILYELWTSDKIKDLENSKHSDAVILIGTVYPLVSSGPWLQQKLEALLEGHIQDKLVALQVLARHPSIMPLPFSTLNYLDSISMDSSIGHFVSSIAVDHAPQLLAAISQAVEKKSSNAPIAIKCSGVVLLQNHITTDHSLFVEYILTLAKALQLHSTSARVRSILLKLCTEYKGKLIYNKPSNRLLICRQKGSIVGVVVDLKNAVSTTLSIGTDQARGVHQFAVLKKFEFDEEGKYIVAFGPTYVVKWIFPNLFTGFFKATKELSGIIESTG